jgi:hypothetical protein
LTLRERGAFNLLLLPIAACVLHLERTAAAQLNAIVQYGSGGQTVGTEAGAGIINLQQLDRSASAIFYRGINVI